MIWYIPGSPSLLPIVVSILKVRVKADCIQDYTILLSIYPMANSHCIDMYGVVAVLCHVHSIENVCRELDYLL